MEFMPYCTRVSPAVRLFVASASAKVMLSVQDSPRSEKRDEFNFQSLGHAVRNRIASAAEVPGDPSTYYAGAASGGVWKSTDGGNRLIAIFDDMPVRPIRALALTPGDLSTALAGKKARSQYKNLFEKDLPEMNRALLKASTMPVVAVGECHSSAEGQ